MLLQADEVPFYVYPICDEPPVRVTNAERSTLRSGSARTALQNVLRRWTIEREGGARRRISLNAIDPNPYVVRCAALADLVFDAALISCIDIDVFGKCKLLPAVGIV
ncbi:hypothetical protein IVB38_14965 [Bradyrhizobium sp. 38]|uniref:hypothetical protein n=1 Tax=unclassified Bradyrhizobium TaxID=2631580 RepID=UPI001FFA4A6B|nr:MULTISPECIES: hypothetical protein [unclassified Bradyrhizobium]MCK1337294.1 hypothetical protein [Bradyrhizobium sp. 38]MCK1777076.1 hypothetical protein [Bradyrhizobium sp. 132]